MFFESMSFEEILNHLPKHHKFQSNDTYNLIIQFIENKAIISYQLEYSRYRLFETTQEENETLSDIAIRLFKKLKKEGFIESE